jgi:hypothetical protein
VGSVLLYTGFLALVGGALSILRLLHFLGPALGMTLLLLGILGIASAVLLPAPLERSKSRRMRLDDFVPAWQFGEVHAIRIHASPERVYGALRFVTAGEIRLFRTLTWIREPRRPWRKAPESILAPPARQPILDVALRSGFLLLADEPPREIVVGTVVCGTRVADAQEFARLDRPGHAKAGMNFVATDEGAGWTRLRTETRVYATDNAARRRFGLYWRAIYPGSALIRLMWLRAVRARAEAAASETRVGGS